MLSMKHKTITIFICALSVYFILAFSVETTIDVNMGYSLFIYLLGVYFFTPVITGKPMAIPYSGTVLLKGKDRVVRGFFSFIYFIIAVSGLSVAILNAVH